MKWNEVLDGWESGNILSVPIHIKNPFIWRTSMLDKDEKLEYKEEFIEDARLLGHEKQELGIMAKSLHKKKV